MCDPRDYSPPGSSVHGILQARILEWVAIPFSRGFSRPRDRPRVSCIAGRLFPTEPPGKVGLPRPASGLARQIKNPLSPCLPFFFSVGAGICQLCMLTSYQKKSVRCQFAISGFRPLRTGSGAKFLTTRRLGTDFEGRRPGCQNVSSCRQGNQGNDSSAFACLGQRDSNLQNQAPLLYTERKHLQDIGY